MPWPIVPPTGTRTNTTPHANTHPDDHNKISQALADVSSVLQATGRVIRWGGGPYTTTQGWNIGNALPTFPYAGVVALAASCSGGFGSVAIDLLFDGYSDSITAQGGGGWGAQAKPGFGGWNGAVANPGISPFTQIVASSWAGLGSIVILSPVAAGGKADLKCRVIKGANGNNFYVDGYAWATYMPGATIPTTQISPG